MYPFGYNILSYDLLDACSRYNITVFIYYYYIYEIHDIYGTYSDGTFGFINKFIPQFFGLLYSIVLIS